MTRAIEIDPGSSSFDPEALVQSPACKRRPHLVAGEPRRLGDLAVVERELFIRVTEGVEADHQRARKGPGLAAQITHVADGQADLLADLADDTDLKRLAGLDEPCQQREHPLGPHRLAGQHRTVAAVMNKADHRGVDARKLLVTADRVDS